MLDITDLISPNYDRNSQKCGELSPCVICGKPTENAWWVHLVNGGTSLALPDEKVDEAGDMNWYPLGNSCRKKYPQLKPYAIKTP